MLLFHSFFQDYVIEEEKETHSLDERVMTDDGNGISS